MELEDGRGQTLFEFEGQMFFWIRAPSIRGL